MLDTLLSLLVFVPLILGLTLTVIPTKNYSLFKWTSLLVSIFCLATSLFLWYNYNASDGTFQFIQDYRWFNLNLGSMGAYEVRYILGIDGVSLSMVFLTGLVFTIAALASWGIEKKVKAYHSFFLILLSSVMGCFMALDFFLFFLFFEFMLLPMYFLIGIWGGKRREYASLKFIIYTLVGSVLILIVLLVMGAYSDLLQLKYLTFDIRQLANLESRLLEHDFRMLGYGICSVLFLLLLVGFGVKLPTVPLHTWLPDAHVEAPTPISVVLAGVLLKVGAYGFLRLGLGLFPITAQQFAPLIAILGVVSIIYAALNALAQQDLKKLIAYSSVSHMGFVFLGFAALNSEGINGAVYQMFSHGILSSMLFLIVGVVYDRTASRKINDFRGLASQMPIYTFTVIIAFFGSMGLPGISGFIGEFFTLMGGFKSELISNWIPAISVLGIILAAGYMLWTLQRMFFGTFWVKNNEWVMDDLSTIESLSLISLAIMAIIFGVYPKLLFELIGQSIDKLPF